MKKLLLVMCLLAAGCAATGPVVTNISYDAKGALSIEKCKVHTNFFLGTMELQECHDHSINIEKSASSTTAKTNRSVASDGSEFDHSGCCSHHGGVCGCSGTSALCCDGVPSPSCGCN